MNEHMGAAKALEQIIAILETAPDWSADTLDAIAQVFFDAGYAHEGPDGFAAGPGPGEDTEASAHKPGEPMQATDLDALYNALRSGGGVVGPDVFARKGVRWFMRCIDHGYVVATPFGVWVLTWLGLERMRDDGFEPEPNWLTTVGGVP